MYVISDGGDYDENELYWSNLSGWGTLEDADVYNHTDHNLPWCKYGSGIWVKLPKCLDSPTD